MSFWLICLSTFSWACLSVPYWIVKSQHFYTYVTRPLRTFVTAVVGATLFVLLDASLKIFASSLESHFLQYGFWMTLQWMHDRYLLEASPYAARPLDFQARLSYFKNYVLLNLFGNILLLIFNECIIMAHLNQLLEFNCDFSIFWYNLKYLIVHGLRVCGACKAILLLKKSHVQSWWVM